MRFNELPFKGRFEEELGEREETLQVLVPENELEQDLLSWALLEHPETVEDPDAPIGRVYHYELAEHLENGLYRLRVTCRQPNRTLWEAEMVAGLASFATSPLEHRLRGFSPYWLMKKGLHFKASQEGVEEHYGGPAFGTLRFTGSYNLPHRRLFKPTDNM